MSVTLLLLLSLVCFPGSVLARGELGHRAIGEAVQENLDPATREAIANILNPGQPLADGALARLSV